MSSKVTTFAELRTRLVELHKTLSELLALCNSITTTKQTTTTTTPTSLAEEKTSHATLALAFRYCNTCDIGDGSQCLCIRDFMASIGEDNAPSNVV
jgi:hypothetical protein